MLEENGSVSQKPKCLGDRFAVLGVTEENLSAVLRGAYNGGDKTGSYLNNLSKSLLGMWNFGMDNIYAGANQDAIDVISRKISEKTLAGVLKDSEDFEEPPDRSTSGVIGDMMEQLRRSALASGKFKVLKKEEEGENKS